MVSPKGSKDETRGACWMAMGRQREGVPKGRGPGTLWGVWGQLATGRLTDLPPGQVCWRDSYLDVDVLAARHCIWVGWFVDGKKLVTVEGRGVEAQARRVDAGGRSVMGRKVSKTGQWTSGPPWGPHVMRQPICHPLSARTPSFCKRVRYRVGAFTLQPSPAQRAMTKL